MQFFQGERRLAVLKQSAWATFMQVVEAIRGFLIVFLAVRAVGLGGYGLWLTVYGLLQASTFLDLGITGPLQRSMTDSYARGQPEKFSSTLVIGIWIASVMACIIFIVGLFIVFGANLILAPQFSGTPYVVFSLILASFASAISNVNTIFRAAGTAQLKPDLVIPPMVIIKIIEIGLTVSLFFAGCGLLSIAIGSLFYEAATMLYYTRIVKTWSVRLFIPKYQDFAPWFSIARITFISRFLGGMSDRLEPTIIGIFIGIELASIYSISKKLAVFIDQVLHTVWAALMGPLTHFVAQHSPENSRAKVIQIYIYLFSGCLLSYAAYLFVNSTLIYFWIGPQAVSGFYLYFLIALSAASIFIFDVVNSTIIIVDRPHLAAMHYLCIAIVRMSLMVLLALYFGINGIIWGAIFSNSLGIAISGMTIKHTLADWKHAGP